MNRTYIEMGVITGLYPSNLLERIDNDKCRECGEPIGEFLTEDELREFIAYGTCPRCCHIDFDTVFGRDYVPYSKRNGVA